MFTTFDKALVALVMSVLSILNMWFGIDISSLGITPESLSVILAALTPVFVWFFPNRTA